MEDIRSSCERAASVRAAAIETDADIESHGELARFKKELTAAKRISRTSGGKFVKVNRISTTRLDPLPDSGEHGAYHRPTCGNKCQVSQISPRSRSRLLDDAQSLAVPLPLFQLDARLRSSDVDVDDRPAPLLLRCRERTLIYFHVPCRDTLSSPGHRSLAPADVKSLQQALDGREKIDIELRCPEHW
ncbi:hypothetical protein GBAR_LOCUS546 [Geodia barretti]|uniref:Uncharacterized protein n=1 Tax=Geodia barretti TaxID=519541 RepID=A0AA35VST5_GEOBA|nr:hypothetical protein GBAR_LOCUS546 [Geodia barretti]